MSLQPQSRLRVDPRIAFTFLCAAFLTSINVHAASNDTLALINGKPVTSDAFRYRFELSVYPGKDNRPSLDSTKKKFLLSLIAERLLALSAQSEDLIDSQDEQIRSEAEGVFLRDALFRGEVVSRVKVSKDEISSGLRLSSYRYLLDTFYFPDSMSALRFYQSARGLPVQQFYATARSAQLSHDTLLIGYGESTETIEAAFFAREPGFVSKPTLTEDGFVVFRILDRSLNKKFASASPEERRSWVEKVIRSRKEDRLGFEYVRRVMHGIRVQVNREVFRPLALAAQSRLGSHQPTPNDPHYHLSSEDIISLRSNLAEYLNQPVLQLDAGSLTLDEVLEKLPLAGFTAGDTSIGEVASGLHTCLKFIAQNHFLSKRARELGLENSPEVRENVELFVDAFRAFRVAQVKTEGVAISDAEVDSFFNVHRDVVLDNVLLRVDQYSVGSIDEAADLFNRLNRDERGGTSFLSPKGREVGGDTVWMRASELGEVGAVVAELKPGEIYGPVPKGGQFVIYKLLEKESAVSDSVLSNSIRVAKNLLLAQKKRRVLNEYVAVLAEQSNVRILFNRLHGLDVTPLQMFTLRYIGFGGKITAVPPLCPREDWVKYLRKKASIVQ
jgi:hypothetical protein